MNDNEVTIKGLISVVDNYDPGDGVFVGDEPLSEQIKYLNDKVVTVLFYTSDTEKTFEELQINSILSKSGALYARYEDCYSEYTGYLYTTDDCYIGNHCIVDDIRSHEGKYAYIKIIIQS